MQVPVQSVGKIGKPQVRADGLANSSRIQQVLLQAFERTGFHAIRHQDGHLAGFCVAAGAAHHAQGRVFLHLVDDAVIAKTQPAGLSYGTPGSGSWPKTRTLRWNTGSLTTCSG